MGAYSWRRRVGVVAVMLILSSCTDNADLFSSLDEDPTPELEAVSAGAVVSPEEPLSIQISYPDEDMSRASALTVELRTPGGDVVGSLSFTEEQLLEPELPAIELPQPSPGPYILFVEALRGDEILFIEERQIFVTATPPVIESVSVYPSTVGSDETAVAVAEVRNVGETRPFLRWTFFDELIGEGYVDAGVDKVTFDADGRVGVHPVEVELFPWGPDEGVDLALGSAITATTDVFIRERARETASNSNVLVRYRFDGSYTPDTDRMEGGFYPIQRSDGVTLGVREERLGVTLAHNETIIVPYDVIPTADEAYRLSLSLIGGDAADGLIVAVGYQSRSLARIIFNREMIVVERSDRGVADEFRLTDDLLVSGDSGDAKVSIVFASFNGVVYAIPNTVGGWGEVVEIGRVSGTGDETPALTFEGSGAALIEEIAITRIEDFSTVFRPSFGRFLYGDEAERLYRFLIDDIEQEHISLTLPDDRFAVFSDASRSESYVVWRDRDIVTISEIPNGASPSQDLEPNRYAELTSGRSNVVTLSVRTGVEIAVTPDGEVVLPRSLGRRLLVRVGATSSDASPFAIGTDPF